MDQLGSHSLAIQEKHSSISRQQDNEIINKQSGSVKINGKELKGVPKHIHLHLYRIYLAITTSNLKDHMKCLFLYSEALNSKYPNVYATFKINGS